MISTYVPATPVILLVICVSCCVISSSSLVSARMVMDYLLHEKKDCEVYQNEALHAVLDKLCGDCNDLFRHELSDLYAKCRRNCFENKVFQMCWQAINPSGARRK